MLCLYKPSIKIQINTQKLKQDTSYQTCTCKKKLSSPEVTTKSSLPTVWPPKKTVCNGNDLGDPPHIDDVARSSPPDLTVYVHFLFFFFFSSLSSAIHATSSPTCLYLLRVSTEADRHGCFSLSLSACDLSALSTHASSDQRRAATVSWGQWSRRGGAAATRSQQSRGGAGLQQRRPARALLCLPPFFLLSSLSLLPPASSNGGRRSQAAAAGGSVEGWRRRSEQRVAAGEEAAARAATSGGVRGGGKQAGAAGGGRWRARVRRRAAHSANGCL